MGSCGFLGAESGLLSPLGRTGGQTGRRRWHHGGGSVRLSWFALSPPPGQTGTVGHLLLSPGAGLLSPSHTAGSLCAGLWDSRPCRYLQGFWEGECREVARSSAQVGLAPGCQQLAAWAGPRSSESRNPGDAVPVPTQKAPCVSPAGEGMDAASSRVLSPPHLRRGGNCGTVKGSDLAKVT